MILAGGPWAKGPPGFGKKVCPQELETRASITPPASCRCFVLYDLQHFQPRNPYTLSLAAQRYEKLITFSQMKINFLQLDQPQVIQVMNNQPE